MMVTPPIKRANEIVNVMHAAEGQLKGWISYLIFVGKFYQIESLLSKNVINKQS